MVGSINSCNSNKAQKVSYLPAIESHSVLPLFSVDSSLVGKYRVTHNHHQLQTAASWGLLPLMFLPFLREVGG